MLKIHDFAPVGNADGPRVVVERILNGIIDADPVVLGVVVAAFVALAVIWTVGRLRGRAR